MKRHNAAATVSELICLHAERSGESRAVLDDQGRALRFRDLNEQICCTRTQLNNLGIGRGDRVALLIRDRPQAYVAYLCTMASAVAIPLDPELTEGELAVALKQVGARAVIASPGLYTAETVTAALDVDLLHLLPVGTAAGLFELGGGRPRAAELPGPPSPYDVAAILMSSGTTARPKAIPLTHATVFNRARADATHLGLTSSDVCINFRAPHLSGPLNAGLMPSIFAGGTVLVPDHFDADGFYDALRHSGVTWYTGGPAHHEALLARAPFHVDEIACSKLRFIRSAGYNLSPLLQQKLETTFGVPCVEKYGSTESGLVACNPLPPGPRKPGTVGKLIGCEVILLGEDGLPVPCGQEGEIAVRGECVFDGYDNDPERNAAVLVEGWYRPGDLGRFDSEGYLTICGRVSDVINQGGRKVSPVEVENALSLHPDVADAVCFGVHHPTLGQLVVAAVVPVQGTDLDETGLKQFLGLRLSGYKVPAHIMNCDTVPRGHSGKLLRNRVAEIFGLSITSSSVSAPADQLSESPLVRSLRSIWGDVLNSQSVPLDQNFFMLGGDSLRAVQVLAAVKSVCGIELPQDAMYTSAVTISGMALMIEQMRSNQSTPAKPQRNAVKASIVDWLKRQIPRRAFAPASETLSRPEMDDAVHRLRLATRGWAGTDVGQAVPVFALNPEGSRRPLFWCFNSEGEPKAMATALGPDQPIFAMRSLSQVIADKGMRTDLASPLAKLYAAEITRLQRRGSFLIGGNCQSGHIAEHIAHDLIGRGRRVPLLIALEYEPERPFPGRVALFFGAVSFYHNPFLRRLKPEREWQLKYEEVVWDIVPGKHGQYFTPPHVIPFMEKLSIRLAAAPD